MPWCNEHWQGVVWQQLDAVEDEHRVFCQFQSITHSCTFFVLKPRCVKHWMLPSSNSFQPAFSPHSF
jgi:hypothetical protein